MSHGLNQAKLLEIFFASGEVQHAPTIAVIIVSEITTAAFVLPKLSDLFHHLGYYARLLVCNVSPRKSNPKNDTVVPGGLLLFIFGGFMCPLDLFCL